MNGNTDAGPKFDQDDENNSIIFHEDSGMVTWEKSWIRNHLGNTTINEIFSIEERKYICKTELENKSYDYSDRRIEDSNSTIDRLFFLSEYEVNKYLNDEERNKKVNYWLRNPGKYNKARGVFNFISNSTSFENAVLNYRMCKMFPAFWLNIDPSFKGE